MAYTIPEYEASASQLMGTPGDRASSAHVTAGRRIDVAYDQAGAAYKELGREVGSTVSEVGRAYVDYQAHKEISAGGLVSTQILAGALKSWNDKLRAVDENGKPLTDPNDPTLQRKFLTEQMEPALQKFQESFLTEKGQAWASNRANMIREHLTTTTTADMSTAAGVAAHNQFVQGANVLTSMVDSDPHSIGIASKMLQDQVKSLVQSSTNMRGDLAIKFQTDATQAGMEKLVRAAVESDIRHGGDGSTIRNDPQYQKYINVSEIHQFENLYKYQQRAIRTEEHQQEILAKQKDEQKGMDTINSFLRRLNDADPTKRDVSLREINEAQDRGEFGKGHAYHSMLQIFNSQDEKIPAAKSAATAIDVIKGIHDGTIKTEKEILDHLGKDMAFPQYRWAIQEFHDMKDPDGTSLAQVRHQFMNDYGRIVNEPNQFGERFFPEREFSLFQAARRQEAVAREKTGNPLDAYDRNSPYFVGKVPEAQRMTPKQLFDEHMRRVHEQNTPGTRVPDIGGMTIEELRNLNPAQLTAEQRAAAAKRWNELNSGK